MNEGTTVHVAYLECSGGDPEVRVFLDAEAAVAWASAGLLDIVGGVEDVFAIDCAQPTDGTLYSASSGDGDDYAWVKAVKVE